VEDEFLPLNDLAMTSSYTESDLPYTSHSDSSFEDTDDLTCLHSDSDSTSGVFSRDLLRKRLSTVSEEPYLPAHGENNRRSRKGRELSGSHSVALDTNYKNIKIGIKVDLVENDTDIIDTRL